MFERGEFTASPVCPGKRGNPKGYVSERMVLVTFARTKVTRVRADARIDD